MVKKHNLRNNFAPQEPKPKLRKMVPFNERYLLQMPCGHYLDASATKPTERVEYAYFGTLEQIENLCKKYPEYVGYKRVPYISMFGLTHKARD